MFNEMEAVMKVKSVIFIVFSLATIFSSVGALARPLFARSVIYFDASNNIIGQSVLFCNGVTAHGGIVNYGNAYRIEEQMGCDDPTVKCSQDPAGGSNCSNNGYVNGSEITYFYSATGYTSTQYCNSNPTVLGPFYHHPACGLPAPEEDLLLQPFSSGTGY